MNNTTGDWNMATGAYAMWYNTTGYVNTASGAESLRENTNGNSNTAHGAQSLLQTTVGSNNTALGRVPSHLQLSRLALSPITGFHPDDTGRKLHDHRS